MTAAVWSTIALMATALGVMSSAIFTMFNRMDTLRTELRGEIGELRTEFRSELGGQIGELRADMNSQIGEFRADMNSRFEIVHADIRELRTALRAS